MGNCLSCRAHRRQRPRRNLPRKIKIRDRRAKDGRTDGRKGGRKGGRKERVSSSAVHRRSLEHLSPRSVVSDDSVYYSDNEWSENAFGGGQGAGSSSLRQDAVEGIAEEEESLVDKLANWWHSFSLLGDDERYEDNNSNETDNRGDSRAGDPRDGSPAFVTSTRRDAHLGDTDSAKVKSQQMLGVPRIFSEDGDVDSVAMSCVSFTNSRRRKPLSLTRVNLDDRTASVQKSWAYPDPTTFMVRSKGYMRDKVKLPASCSLYRLVKCETVTFDGRIDHIARYMDMPTPCQDAIHAGKRVDLPPILVIQLQMPMYPPVLFGEHDGESCSLIYYCELEPSVVEAPRHAVDMAVRFVKGDKEEDGQMTRDRLKLIPRIMNVEEWGREAGLSATELRLVTNYNGKPLLMRPQQRFFLGPEGSYFEIDADIHNYAYIARRAFAGYVPRLGPSVFENGFVIQGNNENELPEVMLACSRVYRVDFQRVNRMSIV
jgi:hypothetical protein